MHPYDVRQNLEWVVHLIGQIITVGWLVGWIAGVAGGLLDISFFALFLAVWPLVVGLWLMFASAPDPIYLDEDDEEDDDSEASTA